MVSPDIIIRVENAARKVAKPPPLLTVSQWADEHLYLSPEESAEAGKYRVDRAPYQREMLDAVSDPNIREVVYCTSSQVGKTLLGKAILGYHIHQDPGPILVIQPNKEMAETFSKDRLATMIRDSPVLRGLIADPKSRSSGNTILHKALCLNTPIPTPNGWSTMGKIRIGDIVFDESGQRTTVIETTEVFYGRDCYRVTFSDKTSIVADAGHLWGIWRWKVDKINYEKPTQVRVYQVKNTQDLLDCRNDKIGRHKYAVALNKPLYCDELELPIDPYILGAWLGDGYSHIAVICGDQDDIEMFDLLKSAGAEHCKIIKASTKPNGRAMNLYKLDPSPGERETCKYGHKKTPDNLYSNGGEGRGKCRQCVLDGRKRKARGDFSAPKKMAITLLERLQDIGVTSNPNEQCKKRIPKIYLRASIQQRLSLLQGLMDTDGSPGAGHRFSTSLENLANDVSELLRSLGIRFSLNKITPRFDYKNNQKTGKVSYCFWFSTDFPVFRLSRKKNYNADKVKNYANSRYKQIVSIEPCESVPVRCITVDSHSHLFLAGDGMTPTHNSFTGGHVTLIGANSPSGMASRPIRIVFADEVDRYPVSAGTEGDPIFLARQRSVTYWNRKFVMASTPTNEGQSRIWMAFEKSDKRYLYLPCPHCGEFHTLAWKQIVWDDSDASSAHAVCPICGACYGNADKLKMLPAGEWRKTAVNPRVAGFHISALYSPWQTFSDVVQEFLDKKDSAETLKTFVNLQLGQCWEDRSGEAVDADALMARCAQWDGVPAECIIIVAGVDVQGDRLEVTVAGFSVIEQARVLHHTRLYGNPSEPDVWANLDAMLLKTYTTEDGRQLSIRVACVDSGGHHTKEVYEFCGQRTGRSVHAIKGRPGSHPIWSTTAKKKRLRYGAHLHLVGVDTAKDAIHSALSVQNPDLPHHIGFSTAIPDDYFQQLTAERRVVSYSKTGYLSRGWRKSPNARNEALDCLVYAMAALEAFKAGGRNRLRMLATAAGTIPSPAAPVMRVNMAATATAIPPPVSAPASTTLAGWARGA